MRIFAFGAAEGRNIGQHGSRFTLSRLFRQAGPLRGDYAWLPPGGLIGRHMAASNQILAVVTGEGWVSSGDGARIAISAGQAAFWSAGEVHETTTDRGLTAMIFEGPDLQPAEAER